MTIRSAIWPVAAFGSQAWFFILIARMIFGAFGLIQLALVVLAAVVIFQLVTLPVEFNASRRAMAENSESCGWSSDSEAVGARQTLTAAAMTYVAGALASNSTPSCSTSWRSSGGTDGGGPSRQRHVARRELSGNNHRSWPDATTVTFLRGTRSLPS